MSSLAYNSRSAAATGAVDLNSLSAPALFEHLVERQSLRALLELARHEDLGDQGDITSLVSIDAAATARAGVVAREDGVVAGLAAAPTIIDVFGSADEITFECVASDGEPCRRGDVLARLHGSLRAILAVERTLLNLLSRLSGIATLTRTYVDRAAGMRAMICDTRKTLPGWRRLEKYAVRCGGGTLHRIGLFDAVLLKDNHLANVALDRLGDIVTSAAKRARSMNAPLQFIEVEVDSLEQLDVLLRLPSGTIDLVLLDNMRPAQLAEAVRRRDEAAPWMGLEASGGVSLTTISEIARTGVDRISIGALTHSAPALDIALDVA